MEPLYFISDLLNRYLAFAILLFGTVDNTLNCFVLSQRRFQSNPCAFLFLISSFVNLISLVIGLPTRILAGWKVDPTDTINWICKCRVFIVFCTRTISIWLITLATIDRWLLSSMRIVRRQMSNMMNIKRAIFIIIILSIVFYFHMIPCYQANNIDILIKCSEKAAECRIISDITYILGTILIPLSLMVTFGLLTILNLHHAQTRVHHRAEHDKNSLDIPQMNPNSKKIDRRLFRMLLLQIFSLIIIFTPQAIHNIFITFNPYNYKFQIQDDVKVFLYNIQILIAFIASGMPYYIYILAGGSVFRKAFWQLLRSFKQKLICLC